MLYSLTIYELCLAMKLTVHVLYKIESEMFSQLEIST